MNEFRIVGNAADESGLTTFNGTGYGNSAELGLRRMFPQIIKRLVAN